jgi:hypothetical protein
MRISCKGLIRGANVSTSISLDYGLLTTPSGNAGILIEAANSGGGSTAPAGYSTFGNGPQSRLTAWGSYTKADNVSSAYVTGDITKNARLTGVAFAEVIPEPATIGLVGVFGSAVLFIRRRFMI